VVLNSVRLKEMGVSVKYATPLKENIGEGFQMSGAIPSNLRLFTTLLAKKS
jgi:hypothetical protein